MNTNPIPLITVKCNGVGTAGSADVIDLSATDKLPGDIGNLSSVRAAINLLLSNPKDRGKFQVGKKYRVEFVELPDEPRQTPGPI